MLRNRPGQKLTVAQIRTAIRKDTHKRCSRQAINVNADVLEEAGLIKRQRAPRGSGARFVFWAAYSDDSDHPFQGKATSSLSESMQGSSSGQ